MHPLPNRLYDAYIFDLDGTVYLGDHLLPGAQAAIDSLRAAGRKIAFLSNNPTQTRQVYAARLTSLGLSTLPHEIINSSLVMVDFLQKNHPGGHLFVVGEAPLQNELIQAGFQMEEDYRKIEAVIASFDRTFSYRKLQIAFDALRAGAHFYATNADRYCPVPGGGEPDAASVIAAIEACTNRQVEAVVGKPSRYMADAILGLLGMPAAACLITGDRLETDIMMGLQNGMDAALTLTGATSEAELAGSAIQPTYIIRTLMDLVP